MAKNGELTGKQKRMISAMLSNPTIGAACDAAQVGRSTLSRWMLESQFIKALEEAEADAIQNAGRVLLSGQSEALETIRDIMSGYGGTGPGVRLKAANDWLGLLFKYREVGDLEERIAALEMRIK